MRLALPTYNPVKECKSCKTRDEFAIAARILSFQLADRLLRELPGQWKLGENEIVLYPEHFPEPIELDLASGTVNYKSVITQIVPRYSPAKGIGRLADEVRTDLVVPAGESECEVDQMFTLFLKLTEIFHARCGLTVVPYDSRSGREVWEIRLGDAGPQGWVRWDLTAENRFGEAVDLKQWAGLRPEKLATYLFGFNRFCRNYPSPV